ncbi:MAG: signal peptidase I [Chloroflexi bacterium]|nr:signal peptidase I [Chloroflexota bacterium]|tara:strand:+ start:2443 stop:2895 length:453 start_codon:yes stop_codon:yes gene_type:complete
MYRKTYKIFENLLLIVINFFPQITKYRYIRVNGPSMEPTLKNNSIFFMKRFNLATDKFERFSIIRYKDSTNKLYIKRIIGLPLEKVEIKESKLFIDGKYHKKNLLDKNKNYSWALEQNQIIVLGDNYLNSFDSRKLGPINLSDIQITHIR